MWEEKVSGLRYNDLLTLRKMRWQPKLLSISVVPNRLSKYSLERHLEQYGYNIIS